MGANWRVCVCWPAALIRVARLAQRAGRRRLANRLMTQSGRTDGARRRTLDDTGRRRRDTQAGARARAPVAGDRARARPNRLRLTSGRISRYELDGLLAFAHLWRRQVSRLERAAPAGQIISVTIDHNGTHTHRPCGVFVGPRGVWSLNKRAH